MRYIILFLTMLFLVACTNQRKATKYFNGHPDQAAVYCAEKFPVKEETKTTVRVDTVSFENFITDILKYSDSLTSLAEQRNNSITVVNRLLNNAIRDKKITEQTLLELQEKMRGIAILDTAQIRKSVEAEIRRTLKPCKDSLIITTKENTSRVKVLENRNAVLTADLERIYGRRNFWRIVALISIALILGYVALKMFGGRINFLSGLVAKK